MARESSPVGWQDAVIQHPSRKLIESSSEERHTQYNKTNESVAERAQAGGLDNSTKLEQPPSSGPVGVLELPMVTSAPSTADSGTSLETNNTPGPSIHGVGEELTEYRLQLLNKHNKEDLNERLWARGTHGSLEARKGSATQASHDSVELGDPWVPVDDCYKSDICGVGSWADVPKPPML